MIIAVIILTLALVVLLMLLYRTWREGQDFMRQMVGLSTTLELREQELVRLSQQVSQGEAQLKDTEQTLRVREVELEQTKAMLQEAKASQEQLADLLEARFRGITTKLIDERAELLHRRSEESLKPLREDLKRFGEQVQSAYVNESRERHSLQTEIRLLVQHSQQMSQETQNLTKALKGDNKVQGDWGEMILENILVTSGLRKGEEYTLQETLRDEQGHTIYSDDEGRMLRPDALIHYPNGSTVIIDSKVSLKAYAAYVGAETEAERNHWAEEHLLSVRRQIDLLASKAYHRYVPQSADFVLLFIPNEPAYILALKSAPSLWEEAYKKNVVILNAANLLATLRMAKDLWQRDGQIKNVNKIFKQVGDLYDKFALYLETFDDVEKKFASASKSLEKARGQLLEGPGNVIRRFDTLKQMGAKTSRLIQGYEQSEE